MSKLGKAYLRTDELPSKATPESSDLIAVYSPNENEEFKVNASNFIITPEQSETLLHFVYNPVTDKLEADRAIESTLSSFFLGGQHSIASGGENVFFTELSTNTAYLPCWTGVKNQQTVANRDATGIIKPFSRMYSDDMLEVPLAGAESNPVVYGNSEFTGTLTDNLSSYGFVFRPEKDLPIGTKLIFSVRRNDINGILIYEQVLIVDSYHTGGDLFEWWFDHPLEGFTGDTFLFCTEVEYEGQPVEIISASLNTTLDNVWSESKLRFFDDENIVTEAPDDGNLYSRKDKEWVQDNALDTTYDNSLSDLEATNVQDAIDEENMYPRGVMCLQNNATVTALTQLIPAKVAGAYIASGNNRGFTHTSGTLTYTGRSRVFDIHGTVSIYKVSGTGGVSDVFLVEIYKNGSLIGCGESAAIAYNNDPTNIDVLADSLLVDGDTVEIYVTNLDSNADAVVENMTVLIR